MVRVKIDPGVDISRITLRSGSLVSGRGNRWGYVNGQKKTYSQAMTACLGREEEVKQLWADVSHLAQDYLNLDLLVTEQAPGQWDAFVEEATRRFGVFKRFRSSWPLRDYITKKLANRKYDLVRKERRARDRETSMREREARARNKEGKEKENAGVARKSGGSRMEEGKKSMSVGSSRVVLRKAMSQVLVEIPARKVPATSYERSKSMTLRSSAPQPSNSISPPPSASQAPTVSPPQVTVASQPSTTVSQFSTTASQSSANANVSPASSASSATAVEPADPSEAVRAFLASLTPSLVDLWPTFEKLGIRHEGFLRAMARWPPERLDNALDDMGRASGGEVDWMKRQVVKEGLQRLAGEGGEGVPVG